MGGDSDRWEVKRRETPCAVNAESAWNLRAHAGPYESVLAMRLGWKARAELLTGKLHPALVKPRAVLAPTRSKPGDLEHLRS